MSSCCMFQPSVFLVFPHVTSFWLAIPLHCGHTHVHEVINTSPVGFEIIPHFVIFYIAVQLDCFFPCCLKNLHQSNNTKHLREGNTNKQHFLFMNLFSAHVHVVMPHLKSCDLLAGKMSVWFHTHVMFVGTHPQPVRVSSLFSMCKWLAIKYPCSSKGQMEDHLSVNGLNRCE